MRISDWSSDVFSSDLHQAFEVGFEGRRLDVRQPRGAVLKVGLRLAVHEGAEHQQGGVGQLRVRLVGAQHPVDDGLTVAAAADRHQQERIVDLLQRYVRPRLRSEEHTSELQSLMRISYAVFCLKKKTTKQLTDN